jgi:hypothetical protein
MKLVGLCDGEQTCCMEQLGPFSTSLRWPPYPASGGPYGCVVPALLTPMTRSDVPQMLVQKGHVLLCSKAVLRFTEPELANLGAVT